jgi:hypothetical protein
MSRRPYYGSRDIRSHVPDRPVMQQRARAAEQMAWEVLNPDFRAPPFASVQDAVSVAISSSPFFVSPIA